MDRVLNGAIVGFGEVARNGHWPAYERSAEAKIVAVVDRSADRRALAVRLSPGIRTFATLDELTAAMSVDFVDVCTPPALHPAAVVPAIGKGWHVLCEKPFILDVGSLNQVREKSAASGVAVVPVHNWKYAPIIRRATELLRQGVIGSLREVEIVTSRLRAAPTAEAAGPNWRRDPAMSGGGIVMDHGWHAIYLALHWFGQPHVGVSATLHRPDGGGVEDEASIHIAFPGGEAAIVLTWNGDVRRNAVRLTGSAGELRLLDDVLEIESAGSPVAQDFSPVISPVIERFPSALSAGSHHEDWFTAMLPDVIAAFRDPRLARPMLEEAAACLAIVQAAYRSDVMLAGPSY